MKKKLFFLFLPAFFILMVFSSDNKSAFLERLKVQNQDQVSYTYKTTVSNLNFGKNSPAFDTSDFENQSFTGRVATNAKDGKIFVEANLSELHPDFPNMELYYVKDKIYVNADLLAAFVGNNSEQFKGKFIQLTGYPNLLDYEFGINADLFGSISKSQFKKSNDKLSVSIPYHTILEQLLDTNNWDKTIKTYITDSQNLLSKKSTVTMTLDEKNQGQLIIDLQPRKDKEEQMLTYKLDVAYQKTTYTAPNLPKNSAILTQEEFEKMVEDNTLLSDEDFATVYDSLKDLSAEDLTYFVEEAKNYLTEEQLKQVEELVTDDK